MAATTKAKYDEIVDEIMDTIAEELETLPEEERQRRINAAASYSFAPQQPAKSSPRRNGSGRFPKES